MARAHLRRVGRARRALDDARAEWTLSIIAAVDSGETYRDVAEVAGVSHQRVHQLVRQHRTTRRP